MGKQDSRPDRRSSQARLSGWPVLRICLPLNELHALLCCRHDVMSPRIPSDSRFDTNVTVSDIFIFLSNCFRGEAGLSRAAEACLRVRISTIKRPFRSSGRVRLLAFTCLAHALRLRAKRGRLSP